MIDIREEKITIPTYESEAADKNPMFLEKRVYQGSSGKIYPYPTIQKISREKKDKVYNAVVLENDYLRVVVLPELGGRIQRAYDKTNGYDFVYYNHVIKPALVGLTGPWISGGIEFNWPQHHRPSTFLPVDHEIRRNGNGSVTLLTGDVDRIYGTREITSITLYPDKAYIEIKGQLYNGTPLPQTFLWWANPAVAVNDYTQSIFPPDVHNVYDHGKRAVSRFPIATGEYYKHDYSEGVDISRYKNIPVPTSYMAERSDYDFVGGYDYQKRAGLLHVADHHVSTGKKQWTWGCGDFGKAWDRNLTDSDGPYIELMTGVYCDNQPDFSWLKPFEEKVFTQYFMPYKEVGQVKNATKDAVLNVEKEEKGVHVTVYATADYPDAEIRILVGTRTIYSEKVHLSPTRTWERTINCGDEDFYQIKVSVLAESRELVSYREKEPGEPHFAKPAKAAQDPELIRTNEELFLTGQHIEQYRHATFLPDPYYLEGLKRDPGDSRINQAYGRLLLRRGQFSKSEPYFRKAIKRLTTLNPNPYNSESYYSFGLCLYLQGRFDEAYDAFYKSTWSDEQQEQGYYYLAAISCMRGNYADALKLINRSLIRNTHGSKARSLRSALLALLGRKEEAKGSIRDNLSLDAFNYTSMLTGAFLLGDERYIELFRERNARGNQAILQAARDFCEAGLYELAEKTLEKAENADDPLIHYYIGYCLEKQGKSEGAEESIHRAEACSPDYCFPNDLMDILVLENAVWKNASGAMAYYYLGCLYYDRLQHEKALSLWETSEKICDTFPTLERNLAIAYANGKKDTPKALDKLERAFALNPSDARVLLELDQLRRKAGWPTAKRLSELRKQEELLNTRDDLYTEFITLLNMEGQYEEAYHRIRNHNFQTWEGAEGKITEQFKDCCIGIASLKSRPEEKEKWLREAVSYPHNLGEGKLEGTKDNNIWYAIGCALEQQSKEEEAKECFRRATGGASEPAGVMYYYDQPADMILFQGLSYRKLGDIKKANARFYKLKDYGEKHLGEPFRMDYFAVSMPDFTIFDDDMTEKNHLHCLYLIGLADIGLGNYREAAEYFTRVTAANPAHQKARHYLALMSR